MVVCPSPPVVVPWSSDMMQWNSSIFIVAISFDGFQGGNEAFWITCELRSIEIMVFDFTSSFVFNQS